MLFATVVGEAVAERYGISTITDLANHLVSRRAEKLKEMHVQNILGLDNLNFAIPYDDIETIAVTKEGIRSFRRWVLIDIATTNRRDWFRIVDTNAFDTYVNLVQTILPDKASEYISFVPHTLKASREGEKKRITSDFPSLASRFLAVASASYLRHRGKCIHHMDNRSLESNLLNEVYSGWVRHRLLPLQCP